MDVLVGEFGDVARPLFASRIDVADRYYADVLLLVGLFHEGLEVHRTHAPQADHAEMNAVVGADDTRSRAGRYARPDGFLALCRDRGSRAKDGGGRGSAVQEDPPA